MGSKVYDAWDMVRAWGYEVIDSSALQGDAYVADPEPVVLVKAGLSPARRRETAWHVLTLLAKSSA